MTQRDDKEIEKASRENFGKLFYDLAKTTYGAMVIGAIIGLFSTNSVDGKTISLVLNQDVNNALKLDENGLSASITIAKNADDSYQLKVNGAPVGAAINIPKDKVVESGTVEKYEAGQLPPGVDKAGTYIKLVFNI